MVSTLLIFLYLFLALVALVQPKIGLYFFFPIIFTYPSWLLWGKLPLNAGFDDVFLICLFIGSLVQGFGKVSVKWPVAAAFLFCLLAVMGDLSSIVANANLHLSTVWKRGLKNFGLVLLVYSMCATVQTPAQIKKMIYSLLIGAVFGGFFVIFYSVNKNAYNPFQVPDWMTESGFKLHEALGPFITHDTAGGVLGFAVLIAYFFLRLTKKGIAKLGIFLLFGILFLGLLLSNSRSGWIFAGVPIMLSSLFSKRKLLGIVLLILMGIGVFISIGTFEAFESRLEKTATQWEGADLQSRTAGRYEVWKENLSNPKVHWLFFGEGFAVEKTHPHSNYIAMLKNTGCIGILFWLIYYGKIYRRASLLKKYDPAPDMLAINSGIFWAFLGYWIYFLTATPMMWSEVRYIDFFLMTLLFLRCRQMEEEAVADYYVPTGYVETGWAYA